MLKKKFYIELDDEPSLVFIQEKSKHFPTVLQDGKLVQGMRSIVIKAGMEEATTHEIEYITGCTKQSLEGE